MMTDRHHVIRVWDTTDEERVDTYDETVRPCDKRLVLERHDVLNLMVPPELSRQLRPGMIVLLNTYLDGVSVTGKPALVMSVGAFSPDGHPIVDVLADPEFLPED